MERTKRLLLEKVERSQVNEKETYELAQEYSGYLHKLSLIYLTPILSGLINIEQSFFDSLICTNMDRFYFNPNAPVAKNRELEGEQAPYSAGTTEAIQKNYQEQVSKVDMGLKELWTDDITKVFNDTLNLLRDEKDFYYNLFEGHPAYHGFIHKILDIDSLASSLKNQDSFKIFLNEAGKDINIEIKKLLFPVHEFRYHLSQEKFIKRGTKNIKDKYWMNYIESLKKIKDSEGVFKGRAFPWRCYPGSEKHHFRTLKMDLKYASDKVRRKVSELDLIP